MAKTKFTNKLKLILFCGILGAASGAVLWIFLKLIQLGTEFLWDKLPGTIHAPMWYPIAVCTIGGAIIGIFRKIFGDYPQSMKTVIGTVKKTGTYPYRKIVVLLIAAILPLIFGSSVGPEAGLILGCVVTVLPVVQFSGESQMAVLITDYAKYAPLAMIGIVFLKVLLTNLCIQMGLKGGHFFPVIFAAVCLGYGISLLVFPMDASHAVFAAAITTAATLSVSMKKPLAVTCLLFLCFPVRMGLWIFLAAVLAGQIGKGHKNHEEATH